MSEPIINLDSLQLFHGDATPVEARVYAQLKFPIDGDTAGYTLVGTLQGPYCKRAHTLVALHTFVDRGPGATLLAETIVPDPCFWSPDLPAWYRADLRLLHDGKVIAEQSRIVGIRPLGTRRRSLSWNGETWVPRGVFVDSVDDTPDENWRDSVTVRIDARPEAINGQLHTEQGIASLAWLDVDDLNDPTALASWNQWPSLLGVVVPLEVPITRELRSQARNLAWGQRVTSVDDLSRVTGADWLVVESEDLEQHVAVAMMTTRPVIACRRQSETRSLTEARAACDQLQRELAGRGDFAGYLV